MKNLILFDQDTLHYRQSIYKRFANEFEKKGYKLHVVYDTKLNKINNDHDSLFIGVSYSYRNLVSILRTYKPAVIIQFIWLKYLFLFPFMIYCKMKGIKNIVWSHGINMQKRTKSLKKYLYYLRQFLADALIIYTLNEIKYIVVNKKKLFVANNTLNFDDFPEVKRSKVKIREEMGIGKTHKVLLCVGRLNTHNRKPALLLDAMDNLNNQDIHLVIVGPGVSNEDKERIKNMQNVIYTGPVWDQLRVNEIYKMSDIFIMPGGIGLAINHAFYHGLPVIAEDVNHSPEIYYLRPGTNGFLFKQGDPFDLSGKISRLVNDQSLLNDFSAEAKRIIMSEGSMKMMLEGFQKAIFYVEQS